MANKKLNIEQIFQLVSECRQSGKSDRQWCLEHDITPSTFYYWVRKLRQNACEVPQPDPGRRCTDTETHDIVQLDLSPAPDRPTVYHIPPIDACGVHEPAIELFFGQARMLIAPAADTRLITDTLNALRGILC